MNQGTFVAYLSQSAIFELAAHWFCNQKPFLTKCCYSFNLQSNVFFLSCLQRKSKKTCLSESYFEVDLVNKLQGVIDKQRGQIKKLDQSILDFKAENEEVNLSWFGSIHFRLLRWKRRKKVGPIHFWLTSKLKLKFLATCNTWFS